MTKFKKNRLITISIVVILVLSFGSISFAAGTQKWLDAWYGTVKVSYNGTDVTSALEPFVVNVNSGGTSYIPLRVVANVFNKNVDWDATTSTAYVTDKPNTSVAALQSDINIKAAKILQLENKVRDLERELGNSSSINLDSLESNLNNSYDSYKGITFNIALSGTRSDVYVKISFSTSDYSSQWSNLTESYKKRYIQNICNDIQNEYRDAKIQGYIKSSSSGSNLLSFTTSTSGVVSLVSENFVDLQDTLNNNYKYNLSNFTVSIELAGDESDITFNVHMDSGYKTRWNNLSDSEIKSFMRDIYDDIENKYSSATIDGYVYNSDTYEKLFHYWKNSSGTRQYRRY